MTLPLAAAGTGFLDVQLVTVARVVSFTALSFIVGAAIAAAFRWYFRQRVNPSIAVLGGMGAVTLYLNTRTALNQVMADNTAIFALDAVVFNTIAFLTAAIAAVAGGRVGDRAAIQVGAFTGATELEGEVGRVVQTMGRRIAVTLPDEIADIDGYDPIPEDTKRDLAGRTFLFPRGLTVEELRARLVARLTDDHHVGYVDVDLAEDGTLDFIAVGQRVPGIGPTLGPGQAAVAVTADPPNAASPGDMVQVWRAPDGDTPAARVTTAEVRGIAADVVTLALDEQDAPQLAGGVYRLLTLPAEPHVDREFAGLLRAAEETMVAVTIADGSPLVGRTHADIDATVVAVSTEDGGLEAIPQRTRPIKAGETLYVVARPDRVRRLEADASSPAPATDEAPAVDEPSAADPGDDD